MGYIYNQYRRAIALSQMQKYSQALEILYGIITSADLLKNEVQFKIAYCHFKENDTDKAFSILKESISEFPNFPKTHNLISVLYQSINLDLSLKHCNKALELDPEFETTYILKADILISKSEYAKAYNLLNSVKEKSSSYFIKTLCHLHFVQGNKSGFESTLAQGLELYPNDSEFIALKAEINFQYNNFEEAHKYSKKALELNPNNKHSQRIYNKTKYKVPEPMAGAIIIGIFILIVRVLLLLTR